MRTLIALVTMLICWSFAASAQDDDRWGHWVRRTHCDYTYGYCRSVLVWRRVREYRHRHYYRPPEDRWEYRDERLERGEHCLDNAVRVVGDLHATQEGAINGAIRQWQATVRYDNGERFMDIENARGYRWRCDRASTNETTLGKISETVSSNGYQKRCVVIATPCRQPVQRGDRDR